MYHDSDKIKKQNQSYQDDKSKRSGTGEMKRTEKKGTISEYKAPVMYGDEKKKYSTEAGTIVDGKVYKGKLYTKSTLPKASFSDTKIPKKKL